MAVNSEKEKVVLRLKFKEDSLNGQEKFSSKSYTGIKNQASDQAIYNTGKILSQLQTKELLNIAKLETTILRAE